MQHTFSILISDEGERKAARSSEDNARCIHWLEDWSCDFRLPPRRKQDLVSSGVLRSVLWVIPYRVDPKRRCGITTYAA